MYVVYLFVNCIYWCKNQLFIGRSLQKFFVKGIFIFVVFCDCFYSFSWFTVLRSVFSENIFVISYLKTSVIQIVTAGFKKTCITWKFSYWGAPYGDSGSGQWNLALMLQAFLFYLSKWSRHLSKPKIILGQTKGKIVVKNEILFAKHCLFYLKKYKYI